MISGCLGFREHERAPLQTTRRLIGTDRAMKAKPFDIAAGPFRAAASYACADTPRGLRPHPPARPLKARNRGNSGACRGMTLLWVDAWGCWRLRSGPLGGYATRSGARDMGCVFSGLLTGRTHWGGMDDLQGPSVSSLGRRGGGARRRFAGWPVQKGNGCQSRLGRGLLQVLKRWGRIGGAGTPGFSDLPGAPPGPGHCPEAR